MESGRRSTSKSNDRARPVKRALFAVHDTYGRQKQLSKKLAAVRRKVKTEVRRKVAAIGDNPLIELDSSQEQPDALQLHISPTSSPVCSQNVPVCRLLQISPLPSPVHHQLPLASHACSQESTHLLHISPPSSPQGSPLDSEGASQRCATPTPSTSRLDTQLSTDFDSGKKRKRRKVVPESSRKKASDILRALIKSDRTDFSFWKHGIKLKKNDSCSLEFVVKLIHVRQAAKKKADKQTDLLVQPLIPPGIWMTRIEDKSVKPNVYILCSSKCLPSEVVVGSVIKILSPWVETKLPSSTLYRVTYIEWLYDAELVTDPNVATSQG